MIRRVQAWLAHDRERRQHIHEGRRLREQQKRDARDALEIDEGHIHGDACEDPDCID